ncbi:MAG: PD-(D/E)XK nuclease family protein [Gammaproteobacteria bacterium]|nr:PD-(D/E)XK nuclease family protein [Gammaproteobacteria bacterium]
MNEIQKFRDLLHEVTRLDERWRTNRPEPFNVFTVLRSANDEVNLHSRFLHALLNYVDPASGDRENLEAFLREVVNLEDFQLRQARVEREANNIDLLIKNNHQAVIVENKIWAEDQERQLQRYRDDLAGRNYAEANIHIVYLTPYGNEPDPESRGEIPEDRVLLVSYRDEIRKWLLGCQRRAFDKPELRESIAQYIHLVRRMTNTDYKAEHMKELKKLLMQDDNLVLASQLYRAAASAKAALFERFYSEIDKFLHEKINDLPEVDPDRESLMKEHAIKRCISAHQLKRIRTKKLVPGLNYRIVDGAWLSVTGSERIWIGVSCNSKQYPDLFRKITKALADIDGKDETVRWTPWYQKVDQLSSWDSPGHSFHLRENNEQSLKFLSGDAEVRAQLVKEIAITLKKLWEKINQEGISDHPQLGME